MGPEIEMSYPVPRRRVLNLLKLRRAALRIFDFAGAQFMAKMIHPELFADLEPEENLAEFFELYMPTELKGAWTVCLK